MVGLASGPLQPTRWPRRVTTAIPGLHRSDLTPLISRRTASMSPQPAALLCRLAPRTKLAFERMANPRHALTEPAQTMPPRTHLAGRGVAGALSSGFVPAQGGEYGHKDHGHQRKHHIRISLQGAARASYAWSGMPVGDVHWIKLRTMHGVHPARAAQPAWNQCSPPGTSAAIREPVRPSWTHRKSCAAPSPRRSRYRALRVPRVICRRRPKRGVSGDVARCAFPHHPECPIRKRRPPGKAAHSTFVLARRIAESLNRRQKENPAA